MMMQKRLINLLFFLLFTSLAFAQSKLAEIKSDVSFYEGEQLLTHNKSAMAIDYFKQAVENYPKEKKSYIFLAIAYEQQNSYIEAIAVLNLGLFRLGPDAKFYYNLANCYYGLTNYGEAAQHYTFAINHNPDYSKAYLNRANSNVKIIHYQEAIDDYTIYLQLEPEDVQKKAILKMIELLRGKIEEQFLQGNNNNRYFDNSGGNGSVITGGNGSVNKQLDDVLKSFGNLEDDTENMEITPDGTVEDDYDVDFDIE